MIELVTRRTRWIGVASGRLLADNCPPRLPGAWLALIEDPVARLERELSEVLDQPAAELRADESGPGRGVAAPSWRASDLAAQRRSPPAGPSPAAAPARRALLGFAEQTSSRPPVSTTQSPAAARKSWSGAEIGMAIPEDAKLARAPSTALPELPETPPQELSYAAPHRIALSRSVALRQDRLQSPDPAQWPGGPPPTDVAVPSGRAP